MSSDSWGLVLQRRPKGVLCLLSGLRFHELTTQSPRVVWLALPKGTRPPGDRCPQIKAVWVSGPAYSEGVEIHQRAAGEARVDPRGRHSTRA